MAEIIKRNKALSVSPLKTSQTIGAALAFLGINRAIPMLHGSQGCTAFGKIFFVRHFREPIPLQTTAMDQITTVMGSEESLVEGLRTIAEKSRPALIGLPTTGLSETQGSDVGMAVGRFRAKYPEYNQIPVVPVSTPDYSGCLESGFAKAVEAIIEHCVKDVRDAGRRAGRHQINILAGSCLTPGDLEQLKEIVECFGMRPLLLPDLSDSLDGHMVEQDFSPLTVGGTALADLAILDEAVATLVIGNSMNRAADRLERMTGVPDFRFDHLMGLEAVDSLIDTLRWISGEPVPHKIERQRAQLQDAMLDCHFLLGNARVAIAADPDLLNGFSHLLAGVGAGTAAAVAPVNAPVLEQVAAAEVKIGDLEDLETISRSAGVDLLVCNSHGVESAKRLGVPLLRIGFPQFDALGGYQKNWIGYRGSRQALFDLANIMLTLGKGEIHPYRSIYSQKRETIHDATAAACAGDLRY